jgi:5-methylthioadenosine/S-adenosylhomocysteine deaminase
MANISIINATIVTMDKDRRIIRNGAIAIDGNRIEDVGNTDEILSKHGRGEEVIDGSRMIAIPGLINAHTHMFQDLLRGLGDDMELMSWLKEMLYPVYSALTEEDVRIGALLGCAEMIKTGTTFVIDNHHCCTNEKAIDNIAMAIEKTGIKGLVARGMMVKTARTEKWEVPDQAFRYTADEEIKLTEKLIRKWDGKAKGRIRICPAPVAIHMCTPEIFKESKKLSDKYDVPVHTHIAESPAEVESTLEDYGKREAEFLYDLGVLGPRFHVVHGIWLNDREIEFLSRTKTHVIHCPVSNAYLASGVAPIPKMLKAGVNVALATDGPASNNNQDMFGVMKTTALVHKVAKLSPTAIRCEQVMEMATINGAKALGLEKEIGSIEAGKKADIVLVDVKKPHIAPIHRPVSAIVYCAMGSDVDTVIIDGKIVMKERKLLTVDEQEVLENAEEVGRDLVKRAKIPLKRKNRSNFRVQGISVL